MNEMQLLKTILCQYKQCGLSIFTEEQLSSIVENGITDSRYTSLLDSFRTSDLTALLANFLWSDDLFVNDYYGKYKINSNMQFDLDISKREQQLVCQLTKEQVWANTLKPSYIQNLQIYEGVWPLENPPVLALSTDSICIANTPITIKKVESEAFFQATISPNLFVVSKKEDTVSFYSYLLSEEKISTALALMSPQELNKWKHVLYAQNISTIPGVVQKKKRFGQPLYYAHIQNS